ncbi:hypothetical protein M404DRAFT_370314 [Pisolithus tinctorius Marx 270]|uniref:Uncharacterized protein n=1 Tax=Pisolithus tinctorius Marx 270 TaxID=870435 RepID=A0A0C3ICG9_PISTI|nr:hypothetical protein M404DRAFT_370314 [Pisolithus tinctorius Marx 270]
MPSCDWCMWRSARPVERMNVRASSGRRVCRTGISWTRHGREPYHMPYGGDCVTCIVTVFSGESTLFLCVAFSC